MIRIMECVCFCLKSEHFKIKCSEDGGTCMKFRCYFMLAVAMSQNKREGPDLVIFYSKSQMCFFF